MSAAAEHTHYALSTLPHSLGITCRCRFVPYARCNPTWQSWPPCRNRMYLSSIFLAIIGSSNHFSEQCHGPNSLGEDCNTIRWQKGSSKSPSISPLSTTPLHLGGPTTATAFPPPNPKQPRLREKATSKVVDNLASLPIADASFAEGALPRTRRNHPPQTPVGRHRKPLPFSCRHCQAIYHSHYSHFYPLPHHPWVWLPIWLRAPYTFIPAVASTSHLTRLAGQLLP